jgi:biotin synthase
MVAHAPAPHAASQVPAQAPQASTTDPATLGAPFTREQVRALYARPLLPLLDEARRVHTAHHPDNEVQLCTLLSVKTGGCSEDCSYCPQSSKYDTSVEPEKMLDVEQVLASARRAKELGSTRFCMGAAWREVKDGPAFERVLDMVRGVKGLGLEACVTLGMLDANQAARLREAGLDAYNHNIDTSAENYRSIVRTRTFDDRLRTLANVREAGITVCSGGIIGMGESDDDRCEMLRTLANLTPPPESVPINALVPVEGTPLADRPPIDPFELVRMIAVARILMPKARVRLSAGREGLTREAHLLCMLAGANSIFFGEKLLTTPNPNESDDLALLRDVGLGTLAPSVAPRG